MQASAVESGFLAQHDIAFELLVVGGSPLSVGIVALVEHQALVVWLVVQVESGSTEFGLTHSGIRFHLVDNCAGSVGYGEFNVVEEWRLG